MGITNDLDIATKPKNSITGMTVFGKLLFKFVFALNSSAVTTVRLRSKNGMEITCGFLIDLFGILMDLLLAVAGKLFVRS